MQHHHAVVRQKLEAFAEIGVVVIDANMLEHADRDDAVVSLGDVAIILEIESGLVAQTFIDGTRVGNAVLLLRQRDAGDVGARDFGEFCDVTATGVTLSQEQLARASGRALERHLQDSVEFRLQDYRDIDETFDRIVSVGMFEHVGVSYYDAFFRKCAQLLNNDGVMVLHSIGRSEGPSRTSPWIAKYIFPGGYIPSLSEVLPRIEGSGLLVTDIEILRLHYAETLRNWRERFLAHREDVERIYDRRFERMWEFYLAASEMAFREQNMMVMQIQLTKRQGVVPMTRDYIMREEQRLRVFEVKQRQPLRLAGE